MKWINIKDERPNPEPNEYTTHIHLLVFNGKRTILAVCRYSYEQSEDPTKLKRFLIFHTFCKKCLDGDIISNVTHWMPLPEKPKKS